MKNVCISLEFQSVCAFSSFILFYLLRLLIQSEPQHHSRWKLFKMINAYRLRVVAVNGRWCDHSRVCMCMYISNWLVDITCIYFVENIQLKNSSQHTWFKVESWRNMCFTAIYLFELALECMLSQDCCVLFFLCLCLCLFTSASVSSVLCSYEILNWEIQKRQ